MVLRETAHWPLRPKIVVKREDRRAAFAQARAALAKSGTVTLELGVSGVPMITAYKVAPWEAAIARRLIRVPSVILTNLVLGDNVVPEFIQTDCTPGEAFGCAGAAAVRQPRTAQRRSRPSPGSTRSWRSARPQPARRAAEIVEQVARKSGQPPDDGPKCWHPAP